ncbi:MAG: hypothetical protein AAF623_05505 [Planctomycetota bacterium]
MPRQNPDLLDRLILVFSLRGILLHQATLFFLATGTLIVGAIVLWENQKDQISELNEFQLTENKIQLTPQPKWIAPDLRHHAISEIGTNSSILNSGLVSDTAHVMQNVGYIEQVSAIKKSKNGLKIDVVYRQPVAVVELSSVTIPEWPDRHYNNKVLLPIDKNAIVMPESVVETVQDLPMISVLYPARFDQLETWSQWPDERVQDGAEIGKLLAKLPPTGVFRILSRSKPEDSQSNHPFELWPDPVLGGAKIVWGNAPGKEVEGEATAEEKLRALEGLIRDHGKINELKEVAIDIRNGKIVVSQQMKTANSLFKLVK